jgi:hypothetical protein
LAKYEKERAFNIAYVLAYGGEVERAIDMPIDRKQSTPGTQFLS